MKVYFAREGKGDLYKLPPRKEPPTNDWQEEWGLECDLSTPLWASYPIEISFVVKDYNTLQPSSELMANCSSLIPHKHRLQSVSSFEIHRSINTVELTFQYEVLDPMEVWQRFNQVNGTVPQMPLQKVALNGTDLGAMGIGVVDFYDSFLMPEKPKEERWLSNSSFKSGRLLSESPSPYTRPREVAVECVIPHQGEETLLVTSLSRLSQELQKEGSQTLNGRPCYYREMGECRLTRSRLYFTLHLQLISN